MSAIIDSGFYSTPPQSPRVSRSIGQSPRSSPCRLSSPSRCPSSPSLQRSSSGSILASSGGDRFIPSRSAMDLNVAKFNLIKENSRPNAATMHTSPAKEYYKELLAESMFDSAESVVNPAQDESDPSSKAAASPRILAFSKKAPAPSNAHTNKLRVLYSQNQTEPRHSRSCASARHIPSQPEKILDAPEIVDDYYLNLLDWSSQNTVAIALGKSVYLWNASTGSITELLTLSHEEDCVTSVSWSEQGSHLAVGTNFTDVQIWDCDSLRCLRSMKGHLSRVSCLSWNGHMLSSAGRDTFIMNHDVRVQEHNISTFRAHEQEVCGLKWSPDGTQLASGGNDNMLYIWDQASASQPIHKLDQHNAAVKALAWCPWQRNVLASGGGTADRTIRMWNTATGACLNSVDTKSQVCSILWSKTYKELVSSHGYSQNQLTVWKYPTMTKTTELTGHTSRVLHMAMSPDGTTVVSAAGDETLRFWKIFDTSATSRLASDAAASQKKKKTMLSNVYIR